MLFGKHKFRLKILEHIDKSLCQWNNESLLIHVVGGKGVIRNRIYDSGNIVEKQLCIDDKPLYTVHSDNYYCPTCQKIIEEGYGINDNDRVVTEQVIDAQNKIHTLETSTKLMKPLFELMEDGLYLVTRSDLYPTDGEGNFFWSETNGRKMYEGTADLYYKFHVGSGYMSFLYPSQPYSKLDTTSVYDYMERESNVLTGLAYHIEGAMTLLLDGHHRASAACLSSKPLNCIVIARVNSYGWKDQKIEYFWAGGTCFNLTEMNNANNIIRLLKKYKIERSSETLNTKAFGISGEIRDKEFNNKLNSKSKLYPRFKEIAFESMLDTISFERYEELWDKYDDESSFEFEILTNALYRRYKEKMHLYLLKVIRDRNKFEFWVQAFNLLMTYNEEEIEDVVVEYLVEHDYDKHDPIRKIIDEYYKKRP
ncbi:hypothetical protein [Vallitalea okinawensis]|uniref:hypothetical protein n=1 Tax=Vallitalea okinawensis TaxID=2078660 RepID=UPI000CFAF8F8|nr:hypothetical protein [Vallitalea okinawensis]